MVSLDYAQARMSVSLKTVGSKKSVEILNSFQPELERIIQPLKSKYPDFKATVTGGVGSWARVFDAISWSQIQSFGLAFLIISLILIFVRHSQTGIPCNHSKYVSDASRIWTDGLVRI